MRGKSLMNQKMMRHFLNVLVMLATVLLASCNIFYSSSDDDTAENKRGLLFVTASKGRAALLPTGFNFETNTDIVFTLKGTISGGTEETIKSWSASGTSSAYTMMAEDETTYVDAGDWSFTLNVTNGETLVLTGTKTLTVGKGSNTLAFGELSEPAGGTGGVSITLTYPHLAENAVTKVTAAVYQLDGTTSVLAAAEQTITSGETQDSVVFTNATLPSGSYLIKFELYDTVNDTYTLINPYCEYVRVATGCLTTGNCVITDLNTIYTITYNLNGGGVVTAIPGTYNAYETITLPAGEGVTRDYYTFGGWFTDAECTGTAVAGWAAGEKTGDQTFYAKWTPITYHVTYTLNDGVNAMANPETYTVETPTITLAEPTKSGYTFGGWTLTDGNGAAVTEIAQGSHGDMTLYANWNIVTYTITYELDGGTNAAANPATYKVTDADITLATPKKKGYTFDGWTKDSNDGTPVVGLVLDTAAAADVTVYAHWTANYLVITASAPVYSSEDINLTVNGTTFSVDTGFESYSWYVDGVKQTSTTNTITLTVAQLTAGKHQILAVVKKAGKNNYYSAISYYTCTK